MSITIDTSKVFSMRLNDYDAKVLERISMAHGEIPDIAGLVRKALAEYENMRRGGGTKEKLDIVIAQQQELIASHREAVAILKAMHLNQLSSIQMAQLSGCDAVEDAQ